ncbi:MULTISPECIES: hypothetical protein [Acinetobacter]|jgi:hypothetical protein|uniref:Uncharacterized protein n=1 Tax=Acinetobacter schindleri CIP 107287 TaxID=1217988 RepID=N8Z5U6_9GAMM|nr:MULTISPECIES: hypothetical protein [Acinetobacter]ENV44326.1 hypothetical protein F955_02219 [Acinetobacter schindleri CIP 107287]ENX02141.1 hypothetical protein F899_01328 [Acinetobacter sp. CIP 101934]MCU4520957.1 hypothetical protein [Acinetobacter schindleri]
MANPDENKELEEALNEEFPEEELDPQEKQDLEIQRGQLGIDKDPQVKRDQIRQRHEDEEDENP